MFQGEVVGESARLDGTRITLPRFGVAVADKSTTGIIEAMPLWAGESVSAIKTIQSASDIIRELCDGAEALLQKWC